MTSDQIRRRFAWQSELHWIYQMQIDPAMKALKMSRKVGRGFAMQVVSPEELLTVYSDDGFSSDPEDYRPLFMTCPACDAELQQLQSGVTCVNCWGVKLMPSSVKDDRHHD